MSKRIFTVLPVLLTLLLAACGSSKVQRTEEEIIESLIKPTVMITVGEYRASGVIIDKTDKELVIASVAHLMDGYDQGIVTFYGGKVGFANVLYCDVKSDVCILTISSEFLDKDYYDLLETAVIDMDKYEAIERGEEIYLVGSQVSVAGNIMKGTFEAKDYYVPEFDEYLLYLYCDAFEGMSGGGCYDSEGNLIGLVTGASDTGEVVCIPIRDYMEWRQ